MEIIDQLFKKKPTKRYIDWDSLKPVKKSTIENLRKKKIAIVCDWLDTVGGAERVVKTISDLFPKAPIYTSIYRPKKIDWFKNRTVKTGWLNFFPSKLRKFLSPLRYRYFRKLNLDEYDIVITSTGAEAKAVRVGKDAIHICYMHAPTQYYWAKYDDYIKNPGFGFFDPIARFFLKTFIKPLRKIDKNASKNPDVILTPSTYLESEISKYYKRPSIVLPPPVNIDTFYLNINGNRNGFVIASRQVPWKKVDIVIEACKRLDKKLVVIGDGSEHEKLVALSNDNPRIEFLPQMNLERLKKYFSQAEAFIFPSIEPFGITPIEALSVGTPVVAMDKGGALDFIEEGQNGVFFSKQYAKDLVKILEKTDFKKFDAKKVQTSATKFSEKEFVNRLTHIIAKYTED